MAPSPTSLGSRLTLGQMGFLAQRAAVKAQETHHLPESQPLDPTWGDVSLRHLFLSLLWRPVTTVRGPPKEEKEMSERKDVSPPWRSSGFPEGNRDFQ